MKTNLLPIYLASKSPRRRKLLKLLKINFKAVSVELNEEILDGEHPIETVKRLATQKMDLAKRKINEGIIITADTIVVLGHKIIGKPADEKDAARILRMLSNKTHEVYTGFAIYNTNSRKIIVDFERTFVKFRKLTRDEIREYIKSGSPMDKAGAYGIQDDFGAVFIESINGCYYNVVGLPLAKFYSSFKKVV
jgi:septum formation protein